jgi:L-lactate dehydrogenase complex protein LldG
MTDARTDVLARIRAALAPAPGASAPAPTRHGAEPGYLGPQSSWETGTTGEALLALLTDRIVDYKATVTRATPAQVADVVGRLLTGAKRAVVPAGLDRTWLAVAEAAGTVVVRDDRGAALTTADLDGVDVVVTGSRVAIAETGTIVLDAAPDQGRRAISLVPDHHVCVVRGEDVVRGLPAAMSRLDITRPLTWISGPSATSDIELQRVEGVHGPRRLDVIVVVTPVADGR